MTGIVIKERRGRFGHRDTTEIHTQERTTCRWRQRLEQCVYKPRNAKDCQQPPELEETRKILP